MQTTFSNLRDTSPPEVVRQSGLALFETTVNLNLVSHYGLENEPILDDQLRLQKDEYENYDTSLPEDPSKSFCLKKNC